MPHEIPMPGDEALDSADPVTGPTAISFLRRFLGSVSLAAALVHPTASLLSRSSWTADLICHFQAAALTVTLVAVGASARRARKTASLMALLAAVQVWPFVRFNVANPVMPDPASPERLRVLMANVYYLSPSFDSLRALIEAERPDVVGFVEYSSRCRATLEPLRATYPYRVEFEDGPSGIAIWFKKKPIALDPPRSLVSGGNPVVHGVFEFAGKPRHIWVVHPNSPLWGKRRLTAGNVELDAIAARARSTGGSGIVVGDLNSTDGSAHFSDFLRVSGLRDSRHGFGRQPSWPADFFYKIPIDHAFVAEDLAVVERRLGRTLTSDHYPLIIDLAAAAPAGARAATHSAAEASAR